MNSPFNALTVFTKFMSSPTDGVEIISKIVDSPADVVEFMQNLMHSPEDAIDIMNKFMNTPAEALRILNRILSGGGANAAQQTDRKPLLDKELAGKPPQPAERVDTVIQSMLGSGSPPISPHGGAVDLQYHSPGAEEQPSTSSSHPLPYIANSPDFDLKTFMQTNYNDEPSLDSDFSINSIESVLSEVIRIEYQAFNSIQHAASRVKEEMSHMGGQSTYGGCNAAGNGSQQPHLQQPICAPSSVQMDRELNEAEQMKLRELRLASEALYDPVDEDLSALMMGDDRIKVKYYPPELAFRSFTYSAPKQRSAYLIAVCQRRYRVGTWQPRPVIQCVSQRWSNGAPCRQPAGFCVPSTRLLLNVNTHFSMGWLGF